jgi:hypothetical protein
MSDAATSPADPLKDRRRGVNLDVAERAMRQASGTDLTEAKEALVEGLLQLAVQRCTGEGDAGEFVFWREAFREIRQWIPATTVRRDRPGR